MKHSLHIAVASLFFLILTSTLVFSAADKNERNKNRKNTIEASLTACADLSENDDCTFIAGQNQTQVSGNCQATRSDELACTPEGQRRNRQNVSELLQATIDACSGIATGDACTVVNASGQEVSGVCGTRRSDETRCLIERSGRGQGMGRAMGRGRSN